MATTRTTNGAAKSSAPTIDTGDLAQLEAGRRLVVQYLNEAHATEGALVTTLQAHIAMTPRGSYRTLLERHLSETRKHAEAVERRLGELGAGASPVAAATGALQSLIGQVLALSKGPIDVLRGKSGEEKLLKNAKDERATEALEIATYDALETLATAVGDETTAKLAERHRADEERMLSDLRRHLPTLTHATVLAQVGGTPTYDIQETGAADTARETARSLRDKAPGGGGGARKRAGGGSGPRRTATTKRS